MYDYDFFILGGGSAGYNGASSACDLGLRVGLADGADELGGLCILRGCMPSKTLLESANRFMTLRRAGEFGLRAESIAFSVPEIIARKERLVGEFASYRAKQLQTGRFDFFRGWARFIDPHTVEIQSQDGALRRITSATFLLATGSHIKAVPIPGLEETGFWTSDEMLKSVHLPRSVIVLGGGAVALEAAHYYASFGARVTIIQRSEQLLKEMDGDIAEALTLAYRRRGIDVYCHTQLVRVERAEAGKRVIFKQAGETVAVEAEEIVYALGREPKTDGLELERAGLELTHGRLKVEPTQQTCVPHIFAAGDVAGPYEIVHIAIQQAELAARNAERLVKSHSEHGGRGTARILEEIDFRLRLFVVFSSPEIAMAGLTEQELECLSLPYNVATYPFDDHGKSMVQGDSVGFVKLLTSEATGEIVGGAVIGPHASELIHEIVVAMRFRATARDLAQIPHYHPTLSEIWTYPAEELARK